jgi:hypothetical protein
MLIFLGKNMTAKLKQEWHEREILRAIEVQIVQHSCDQAQEGLGQEKA